MNTINWLDLMVEEMLNNIGFSALEEAKIYSVFQTANNPIKFRVNRRLSPSVARSILRKVGHGTLNNIGGLWVNTRSNARNLINKVIKSNGGVGVVRERHGLGKPHFHIEWPNGRSTHVWFGAKPIGDFFE